MGLTLLKEKGLNGQDPGQKIASRHFVFITSDKDQLQAFAALYRQGITKEQMTLILSTVRLNFEALGISPQPLVDSLSAYREN